MMYYYYQKYRFNIWAILLSIRNVNHLSNFQSIQSYETIHIHQHQARFVLEEVIRQAKLTHRFTIVVRTRSLPINSMLLHIEMIQDTRTIVTLIEYSTGLERHSQYYYTLRELFLNIFQESKIIQTWGNIRPQMRIYTQFGLFSMNEILRTQCMDIQKEFKSWYNRTFRHHIQCQAYVKYNDKDDSSCFCAHRPYKSSSNQWSIKRAVMYTFDEQLNIYPYDIHQCMAISKLAHVAHKQWTFEQVNAYKTSK